MSPQYNNAREDLAPLLTELGLEPEGVHQIDPGDPGEDRSAAVGSPRHVLIGPVGSAPNVDEAVEHYRTRSDGQLARDGAACLFLKDLRDDAELARWRNALWPWLHIGTLVRLQPNQRATITTLQGDREFDFSPQRAGTLLLGARREYALSPDATVAKFDGNASGWNPRPGSRGWGHYRWMRRYVGLFGPTIEGARVLDFGCGAGWVGIEAALAAHGSLAAFDPSPELARGAEENARAAGLTDVTVRTGFGEEPPFPASGEERFDWVISSGVVSFSPDRTRWVDGLCSTVQPGGQLVVGDIHRDSRGMQARRRRKPLLPAREMNAWTCAGIATELAARGYTLEDSAGYQLTWPVPQLMHVADTRLAGLPSPLLLALNKAAPALWKEPGPNFDSWVGRWRAPS